MADAREDERIFLVDPPLRGVIPLAAFHVSRRLARTVRSDVFEIRINTAFAQTVAGCAAPQPRRLDTWINAKIADLCLNLHARGIAHSIETWRDDRLVGGLYGIALGGAFFGESMFSTERDASKVALAHLATHLRSAGFVLLDTQFLTRHLQQFGALEIPKAAYLRQLSAALQIEVQF